MPLLFFIDRDVLDDPACRNLDDVVLSYTFFRCAPQLQPDTVRALTYASAGHGGTRRATSSLTPTMMSCKPLRASRGTTLPPGRRTGKRARRSPHNIGVIVYCPNTTPLSAQLSCLSKPHQWCARLEHLLYGHYGKSPGCSLMGRALFCISRDEGKSEINGDDTRVIYGYKSRLDDTEGTVVLVGGMAQGWT